MKLLKALTIHVLGIMEIGGIKGPFALLFLVALALGVGTPTWAAKLKEARIYIEYNYSANDLGFHVSLDGEDWLTLQIVDPNGNTIFEVEGKGGYTDLGLTELFFEGAEPSLDDFPLEELLTLFPEGKYTFTAETVEGPNLMSKATLSHAVPDGPNNVSAELGPNNSLVISWDPVIGPAEILPDEDIDIIGYQVIVDEFQVTVQDTTTMVTVSPEFVASLHGGNHAFEVLAIDVSGNQTITEGNFTK